jgi:hypothetical protein
MVAKLASHYKNPRFRLEGKNLTLGAPQSISALGKLAAVRVWLLPASGTPGPANRLELAQVYVGRQPVHRSAVKYLGPCYASRMAHRNVRMQET